MPKKSSLPIREKLIIYKRFSGEDSATKNRSYYMTSKQDKLLVALMSRSIVENWALASSIMRYDDDKYKVYSEKILLLTNEERKYIGVHPYPINGVSLLDVSVNYGDDDYIIGYGAHFILEWMNHKTTYYYGCNNNFGFTEIGKGV